MATNWELAEKIRQLETEIAAQRLPDAEREAGPDADSRVWETHPPVCHVPLQKNLMLTDSEREAVEFACSHGETVDASWRYTLRGLLERMRTTND